MCYEFLLSLLSIYMIQPITSIYTCTGTTCIDNSPITCDNEVDCTFICHGINVCRTAVFYCNGIAESCNIDCQGKGSCYSLDVFSETNTTINCNGEDACYYGRFDITGNNNNVNVNITCNGDDSCQDVSTWLRGTAIDNQFYLFCGDANPYTSCTYVEIDCLWDSKKCLVECATNDDYSCLDASTGYQNWLNCPNNGISTGICSIIKGNFYYKYTFDPTKNPSQIPTQFPSMIPSIHPSMIPTNIPSKSPSFNPTTTPTVDPTMIPTINPTKIPTIDPTINPSKNPSKTPTSIPTKSPSNIPTEIPSVDPTKMPTNYPSINPTMIPTIYPTMIPSNNPSKTPTSIPTIDPTMIPTKIPSVAPSKIPTNSPTPTPTSYENTNNITSNYVMNDNFGMNNFTFPAAISQCMNEYFGSNTYIKYECLDENTAMHNIYNDSECTEQSMVSQYIYDNSNDTKEFECDGKENTFIELEIYSKPSCPQSDPKKTSIFVADNVCTSYDNNNNHYRLHCDSYQSDDNVYSYVEFLYYNDDCSIYGFEQHLFNIIEDGPSNRNCPSEIQTVFKYEPNIFIKVTDCFMIEYNDTIQTTTSAITTTTRTTTTTTRTTETDVSTTIETAEEGLSISDISGYMVVGLVIILPILFIIAAFLFHRKREGSDRPGFISLFKFFISLGDFYTDAIWSLTLYSENHELWFWAVLFCFAPHILSIIVGLSFITTWRQMKSKIYISQYAAKFDKVIIILTLISGFYAATEMITSHLFHLDVLSLQISKKQRDRILNLKIINNVILENVPCLYIQYLYLTSTTGISIDLSGFNITLLAMVFSIGSIVFGVLTIFIRIFNGCIEMTRGNKLNSVSVEFVLKEKKTNNTIKKYHIHTHFLLSQSIALSLYVQQSQVNIIYILKVSDGIKVKAKIKFLDFANSKAIIDGLNDDTSELFNNFHKECTKGLKFEPKDIILDISNVYTKQNDVTDDAILSDTDGDGEYDDMNSNDDVKQLKTSIELEEYHGE